MSYVFRHSFYHWGPKSRMEGKEESSRQAKVGTDK